MKLIAYLPGTICLATLLIVGCQETGPGVTASSGEWTTYQSSDNAFQFEYPVSLRRKDRSSDPVGFLLEKGPNDVSIVVMHGDDGEHDETFPADMIGVGTNGTSTIGECELVEIGSASGLRQDYRIKDGSRYRVGSLIAVTTEKDRVVFDVTYPERWKEDFEPVVDRVVASLQFSDSTLQTTKPVSAVK